MERWEYKIADLTKVEKDIGVPASIDTQFQGAAAAFQASLTNTVLLILAAIVTMYIVLGASDLYTRSLCSNGR